ncbi:MAG: SPASM domain-containing protein [Clostridia bacterium]
MTKQKLGLTNNLTSMIKFVYNEIMKKKRLKRVYIEITNICNMNCSFCPKNKRDKKFMTPNEFEFIARQVSEFTDNIYLHVMGEPLLSPYLKAILEISKKYNLFVNLVTNGTLINEKKDILLASNSFKKVTISLHSFEANILTKPLEDYLSSCSAFANKMSQTTNVELRMWNLSNEENAKNKLNCEVIGYFKNRFNYTGDITPLSKCNFKLKKNIYLMFAEKFDWPALDGQFYGDKGYCYALKEQVAILVSGDVVPCCLDNDGQMILGNIFETKFEDIIECDRAKNIIMGFRNLNRVESLCRHCEFSERFKKKE